MNDTDTNVAERTDDWLRRAAAAIKEHEPALVQELLDDVQRARAERLNAPRTANDDDHTREEQALAMIAHVGVVRSMLEEIVAAFDGNDCGDKLKPLNARIEAQLREADSALASLVDELVPQAHPRLSIFDRTSRDPTA